MKKHIVLMVVGLTSADLVSADRVLLTDGQILEGRILSESAYEVEIQTARNSAGTVRTIQVINRDAVKSMSRGGEAVAVIDSAPAEPGYERVDEDVLDITAAHNWLETSTGMLKAGKYEEATARFEQVANHPRLVEQSRSDPVAARPALELRVRAYKLWITAVKGQREYLEAQADEFEKAAESRLDRAEDRLSDYQKEQKSKNDRRDVIELRSRQRTDQSMSEDDYQDAVDDARRNEAQFEQWNRTNTLKVQNLESEYDLLREQLKQIEGELKSLGR